MGESKTMDNYMVSRAFIVSCPRSGTTLLQSLLAAHSDIHSFPESNFFALATPRNLWRRFLGLHCSLRSQCYRP